MCGQGRPDPRPSRSRRGAASRGASAAARGACAVLCRAVQSLCPCPACARPHAAASERPCAASPCGAGEQLQIILPQEASHRIRTTLYLLSFYCLFGEFWFTLGQCVLSQPETVFVNLIKQRPLLGVKYESDSKPSRALGNSSIDCSRLGSILSSVKIL